MNRSGCGVTSSVLRMHGDTFFIDEVFVKIRGKQQYLWGAVDQGGEVVDVFVQAHRDSKAAKLFSGACSSATRVGRGGSLPIS